MSMIIVSNPDFRIEFKRNTLKRAKNKAKRGRKKLADLATPNKKIALYLDRWVQSNFRSQGGKVGGWDPFKIGGRKKNGKTDFSAKLLQDTGALRISHIPFSSKNNAGIGSDIPYSKVHQKGLNGIPQRRTLPVKREVESDVKKIYEQHVRQYKRILEQ